MLYYAYANHLAIKLRPDDFWIIILTQFGLHVNKNSEIYKKTFANKDDPNSKTTITVKLQGILGNISQSNIKDFTNEIMKSLERLVPDNGVIKNFQCNFSTSTIDTILTSRIALMYMVEKYYEFKMILSCGIPSVELAGTEDDWKNLIRKIEVLATIADKSIQEWVKNLIKLSTTITNSYKNPTQYVDFWKDFFFNSTCGSGSQTCAAGWVLQLFLYDQELDRVKLGKTYFWNDLPECLVSTEIQVDDHGVIDNCELVSGMYGYKLENNIVEMVMGFQLRKAKNDGWTLNSVKAWADDNLFTHENYPKLLYNGKPIHEYSDECIKMLENGSISKYMTRCTELRIYYHHGTFKFNYFSESPELSNGCPSVECSFLKGELSIYTTCLSAIDYACKGVKLYP